jgi:hypothetical protein
VVLIVIVLIGNGLIRFGVIFYNELGVNGCELGLENKK